MTRKNQAAQAAQQTAEQQVDQAAVVESTDEAQVADTDAGVVESTEAEAPAGVVTTEEDQAAAPAFVVVSHVKAGGKRYAPGDEFPAELVSDALLAGGSVAKA